MASDYTGFEAADWQHRLRSVSHAIGLAAGGFLTAILLSFVVNLLFTTIGISADRTLVFQPTLTLVMGLAFALVTVAYVRYEDGGLLDIRWPSRSKRTLSDFGWVIAGVIVLFLASRVITLALQQFGLAPGTNQITRAGREQPQLFLVLIVLSFVAVGPGEELLFRGGVQGVLRRAYGPIPAIGLASAIFGVAHVTAVGGSQAGVTGYIVSAFLLGIVLGSLYEYTDNLFVPILIHGAYNAIAFFVKYAAITGLLPS